jgi:hypothetical protein
VEAGGGSIFGEDDGEIQDLETYREKMYKHLRYCSFRKIYEGILIARMQQQYYESGNS